MARLLISISLASLLAGCDRDPPPPPAAPSASVAPSPREPTAPADRFAVSGEAAFDLIATDHGALLAWAKPDGIWVALLGADGAPRKAPLRVASAEKGATIAELSAASSRSATAIAWIERAGEVGTLRSVLGDAGLGSFSPAAAAAPATTGVSGRRGNLIVAGDRERLLAFHRGEPEPCRGDPKRKCTRIAFTELAGDTPRPRRIPLSVPAPCMSAIVAFVTRPNLWHYAVCSNASGRETTTVFRIQYDPRYAEAHEVLAGCTPAGAIDVGDDVVIAGDCDEGRRTVRIGAINTTPTPLDLSALDVSCQLGHPVLATPEHPRFELRLDSPRSGLAAILPPVIAPAGARAVWTGSTLLVARHVAAHVVVERWLCRGADWMRIAR